MSSTAQDGAWKDRETSAEAKYAHEKEQAQLANLRDQMKKDEEAKNSDADKSKEHDIEGGYGGQEDLEDRYATTYGAH
ncbi:hypothetical protein K474DRAFT_1654949 [Panus rudis PR-1116 ss-1]|nr:hypothetical protein K474DRAFT_1654949 [Panus rudis PR-1116 ss-1]